jgi:hypothetical protein
MNVVYFVAVYFMIALLLIDNMSYFIPAVMIIFGLVSLFYRWRWLKSAQVVSGIISNTSPTSSAGSRTINVKFTTKSGRQYSVCTNHWADSFRAEYLTNKAVQIAFDPKNPNDCVMVSPIRAYGLGIFLTIGLHPKVGPIHVIIS